MHDTYCCFCAGPLDDAYDTWYRYLGNQDDPWPPKEGWRDNPPGFPSPTKSREEIVTITQRDGECWSDWVIVGALWSESEYVSPPCVDDQQGIPLIGEDEDDSWYRESGPYICIHRICLSIICRSLLISPKELWETWHGDDTVFNNPHLRRMPRPGLLEGVEYYDIEGRQGQFFQYALERYLINAKGSHEMWYDPASMDDCQWLLARPTLFPKLERLPAEHTLGTASPIAHPLLRLFMISELLDHCLSFLKSPAIREKLIPHPDALSAVLALSQCSRASHALLLGRQDIFYQLALDSGWMLPLCPADWKEWKERQNPFPLPVPSECGEWDWRRYLLVCARGEDVHMRNRARFRRMVVQFGSPTIFAPEGERERLWSVGKLAMDAELSEPEPRAWEVVPLR